MKKKINVPDSLAPAVQELFDREKIDLEIAADQQCDIDIVLCDDRKESDLQTLYSGGWIACETARAVAKRIDIPLEQMGQLLDQLDVKVRKCSLGCF